MFAEKSTELARRLRRYTRSGKSTAVLQHFKNTRDGEGKKMINHDGSSIWDQAVSEIFIISDLMATLYILMPFSVIGIDEGQFFDVRIPMPCPYLKSLSKFTALKYELECFCNILADLGKTVIVAALDGTFTKKPFKVISYLIPHCDEITKLNAVCRRCGDNAPFSRKLVPDEKILDVGGDAMYEANCRKCYASVTNSKNLPTDSSVDRTCSQGDHKP